MISQSARSSLRCIVQSRAAIAGAAARTPTTFKRNQGQTHTSPFSTSTARSPQFSSSLPSARSSPNAHDTGATAQARSTPYHQRRYASSDDTSASAAATEEEMQRLYHTAHDEYDLALDSTSDVAGVAYAAADRAAAVAELEKLRQALARAGPLSQHARERWAERIAALQRLNEELEGKAEDRVAGGAGGS
ncbi:MAG: hypothetical protein M1818_004246 [Claussenomyces sp. TS43310]|nr:MAG: hypothetical protein M1818_004246 [Claussenomyces sp. TS43310]